MKKEKVIRLADFDKNRKFMGAKIFKSKNDFKDHIKTHISFFSDRTKTKSFE